ncbi:hypothetical protein TSACC_3681 [Terrimicrobium sacchariphilum]|uniref:Uncharacterized protein n=1 Tax=Terrimicrobium sacchariphilum TaxID=690879 RepID=A0A146GE88_TERSA|nr:hypothetical protein [Terrimicrobium sacchariphilum]GAT35610.1 hypothetical protein TSACC_3681 [Terrimicrobium sacchariphilum]
MSPAEIVHAMYQTHPVRVSFKEELDAHLQYGWVISTPLAFIMGREVNRWATHEQIIDPWYVFPEGERNAWYVAAYAGAVNTALQIIPFRHRWIGWERGIKSGLRFHSLESFERHALAISSKATGTKAYQDPAGSEYRHSRSPEGGPDSPAAHRD